MILAVLFAWFGYKKATANGRNGILWAIIASGVFLSVQFLSALAVGVLVVLITEMRGGNERDINSYSALITIVSLIASVVSGFLVLHYLDRVPKEDTFVSPPPPPTDF